MARLASTLVAVWAIILCAAGQVIAQELVLLPRAEAAALLGGEDAFIARMTPFDRAARLKTGREVSTSEYLKFAQADVRDWTNEQATRVLAAFGRVRAGLERLELRLPEKIYAVKTSGAESASAAYTRGEAIVLPEPVLGMQDERLDHLIAHELFHVLSRANPGWVRSLYEAIGFRQCGTVVLPEGLAQSLITNPDEPEGWYCIDVNVGGEPRLVMPILLPRSPSYDPAQGGEYIDYVDFRLYVVEGSAAGTRFLTVNEVTGFFEQVGRNTEYVIHPEEILADNFTLLVLGGPEIRSPETLAKIKAGLERLGKGE